MPSVGSVQVPSSEARPVTPPPAAPAQPPRVNNPVLESYAPTEHIEQRQPVSGARVVSGEPTYGFDHRSDRRLSYEQVHGSTRGVGRWVLLAVVAAVALAGVWFAVRPVGPTITGPTSVVAVEPELFTAAFDGAERFEWIDWEGNVTSSDQFTVTPVAPGSLTFSVVAIDAEGGRSAGTQHTITIVEAPDGPRIEGPDTVKIGQQQIYMFTAAEGATDPEWHDPNGRVLPGNQYIVKPDGAGVFRVTLIVTYPDGRRLGTSRVLEFVE